MKDFHGIIYAYVADPELGQLVSHRTSASLPFCGRYRLIDFALSSMVNAGIRDVGVIMQRDYQSLLDHLGSGKDWDLSRSSGGLRLLPPFGIPNSHLGEYKGSMEALTAVRSYIESVEQEYIVLSRGDIVANIDLGLVLEDHLKSGAQITAICHKGTPSGLHHRFIPGGDGLSGEMLCSCKGSDWAGIPSLEVYVIAKSTLLSLISYCASGGLLHFHRDALMQFLRQGGRVHLYTHEEYAIQISTVWDYYRVSMDMLDSGHRSEIFPPERPIRTKERAEPSTYYSSNAIAKNCMIADGCYIQGALDSCVLFRGVRVDKGVRLKNCILMQDTVVSDSATLAYVISDKNAYISPLSTLAGNPRLPLTIPKRCVV